MPRKKRRTRIVPQIPEAEREAILAGLLKQDRAKGMDLFSYWAGLFPRRSNARWERVRAVFMSLSQAERRRIIAARRKGMKGRIWINPETGQRRWHGDFSATREWDPNDPRLELRDAVNAS